METFQYEITKKARHLRYLIFVEYNYPNRNLLNLFHSSLNVWGGRYNPIIPIENNQINERWKDIISRYDPDYIFISNNIDIDFIKKLCFELKFNPFKISNIDEHGEKIEGVHVYNLLNIIENNQVLINGNELWCLNNPLVEYFKLNYFLKPNVWEYKKITKKFNSINIDKDNFKETNKLIYQGKIFNKNILSQINSSIIADGKSSSRFFELIIMEDENSFNDLIYYWNKPIFTDKLYDEYTPNNQLIVTLKQLDILLQDEWFKRVLFYSIPRSLRRVNIVSFSVENEKLETIKSKLETTIELNLFRIIDRKNYLIEDFNEYIFGSCDFKNVQIIYSNNSIITLPNLPFIDYSNIHQEKWVIDVSIRDFNRVKPFLKFPHSLNTLLFCPLNKSRINKEKEFSVIVTTQNSDATTLKIQIPTFDYVIKSCFTEPIFLNEKIEQKYDRIKFNDDSRKLKEFFKLFDNNFSAIESIIFDKFWFDILYKLSTNTKTEGDTILFLDILDECIEKFKQNNIVLGEGNDTYNNRKSLELGLKNILQKFCENNIFKIGYNIKCKICSSKIWYSISEIQNQVTCKGCFNSNYFNVEMPISYKLNHLIKNNIAIVNRDGIIVPDGNLTVIKTIISLNNQARNSFEFLPQIDLFSSYENQKPDTDVDIVCLVDGKLYIGEAKHDSNLFNHNNNKSLNNILELAKAIMPDVIIISCSIDKSNKLDKAKKYLEHKIRDWTHKPEIIAYKTREADYNSLGSNRYFFC